MITLTVVRHGESTDNLRACWAGWADAPLSNHGMNQAKALGASLASTPIDAIFASDLLRALWTGQQIEKHQSDPKPAFTVSPLLREQHFGAAEGQAFGEKSGWVRQPGRRFKFPEGESLEDVRARANSAISQFIEPILEAHRSSPASSAHVFVVAHGIFNAEFIGALLARTTSGALEWGYRGMTNTGWTRMEVGYADETPLPPSKGLTTSPSTSQQPSSVPPTSPPRTSSALPKLNVRIFSTDVTKHLDGVHRQKGGIGSQGFDEKQKDLRAFFSGAAVGDDSKKTG
ncbi:histidine phosphatase superfamily [Naematelia encephala]|uniref:Histidine phosphatase superfamily n=1 Tax=Naematelia encephala TaxID=71784 RepID=A0A1Y2BHG8_9TREE|nr:histidine phosphatase superfamily [Naematelia encephala]